MTALRFANISKRFGRRRIFDGVDVSLGVGECQLLCGENGAGKSTLLRILAGMEPPNRAEVMIAGIPRRWRRARSRLLSDCIYLHQQPYLFEGSVRYNLNYPLSGSRAARDARILEGLEWSGLLSIAEQPVHQLSGGERQRVALVRAWLRGPRVMLLDEPTANMDAHCRQRTVELLQSLKQEGVALLVATHDPLPFAAVTDGTLRLADGRLSKDDVDTTEWPDMVTPIDSRTRAMA